jgi:methylmalonyl-CoA mutase N-terminal domain/subunit
VIGVNKHVETDEQRDVEIHRVAADVERRQIERVRATRAGRDQRRVVELLDELEQQARDPSANLMPTTIELVKARASMGEIVNRLRAVFGAHTEAPVL